MLSTVNEVDPLNMCFSYISFMGMGRIVTYCFPRSPLGVGVAITCAKQGHTQQNVMVGKVECGMEICQATLSSGKKIEEKATEGSRSKLSHKNKLKGHKGLSIKSEKALKGPRSQEWLCLGFEELEGLSQNPDFPGSSSHNENGRDDPQDLLDTSVKLGHVVQEQDSGCTRRSDRLDKGSSDRNARMV